MRLSLAAWLSMGRISLPAYEKEFWWWGVLVSSYSPISAFLRQIKVVTFMGQN